MPDVLNPLDALAAPLLQRAQTREARFVQLHDEQARANRFADPNALLDDVARSVAAEDAALRADLLAAEKTADAVIGGLTRDVQRAARVPTAVESLRGTPSETAQAVHTARLLDLAEAQAARDLLTQPVSRITAVYASLHDTNDASFLAALERALLDAWTPTNPDDAVKGHDLRAAVVARQAARVPQDLHDELARAKSTADKLNTWRLILSSLPPMSAGHLADIIRRHAVAAK